MNPSLWYNQETFTIKPFEDDIDTMRMKKNTKQRLPLTVLMLVVMLAVAFSGCGKKAKDYNVVLIVIDTLRSDHLPFYGYDRGTAPFLTELSKQSIVFENAFSASSWTSPATASIFTSMYPYQHGVLMGLLAIRNAQKVDPNLEINRIPPEIETIAEVMKKNGYQTYGAADNLNIDDRQGFTQGFDKFRTYMYRQAPNLNEVVTKWHKKLTGGGKYFLYLHYMEPHAPYHPREPWFGKYKESTEDSATQQVLQQGLSEALTEKRVTRIAAYDSEINFVDQHIKELYQLFKWNQNTVIVVTADHGEGLWDHGLMAHGKTLYREEIQVPLMIYLPQTENRPGKKISVNVSTLDIVPTIRDILNLDKGETDEGLSLTPLINNDKIAKDHPLNNRDLFSHLWVKTDEKDPVEWKSSIYKTWHYMMKMPDSRHIYSLLTDFREQENLWANAKKTAMELEKRFNAFMKTCRKFKQQTTKYKQDKKETDKLKSLGYVQ